jgi:hypothetical protein
LEKDKILKSKEEEIAKIAALDPLYYYDTNLKRFTLNLEYSNN